MQRLCNPRPVLRTIPRRLVSRMVRAGALGLVYGVLAGCNAVGSSGPTTARVANAAKSVVAGTAIQVVDVDAALIQRMNAFRQSMRFSEVLGESPPEQSVIGHGDVIDIALWEAPPAVLFGVSGFETRTMANGLIAQGANLPQQEVGLDGHVTVPFVGQIQAAGRTTAEIEREIIQRLTGKAHAPQAIVRLVRNEARTVTVVGEVAANRRMPLTPKGERLLDAIATAGGAKHPVGKTTIQVSRGGTVVSMPLDAIIRDPAQNVRLQADDVVTALHQPFSFIALGATAAQAELPFEGGGISLAQALARVGGLRDDKADARGVFVFRMEDVAAQGAILPRGAGHTASGKVPVIYRIDLRDPASFFMAQDFLIRDKDVVYVSNAPLADLQKFVSIISSMTYSIVNIGNAVN